jgi:hypothetical protein
MEWSNNCMVMWLAYFVETMAGGTGGLYGNPLFGQCVGSISTKMSRKRRV